MKKIDLLLNKYIPGGAQTYSRGYDQFPENYPQILKKGKDQFIYDNNNKKFLDYGMGLRSIILGYNNPQVNAAAIKGILNGNTLPRPSNIELKFARNLVNTIPHVEMVKFAKNSSNAVTGAVKIARAYNKKDLILRCEDHPFFSFDDWFIGSTVLKRGIDIKTQKQTIKFKYGDIINLKNIIKKYKNKISCIVMEASTTECPKIKNEIGCCQNYNCSRNYKKINYLKEVESLCRENKIVFIIDETITGFRWHLLGAAYKYDINPDLVIYGKAIANGFSVAVLGGKKKLMDLASIKKNGLERTFLLSSTHGGEMSSLEAANATLNILKKNKTIPLIWDHGKKMINKINNIINNFDMIENINLNGVSCSPYLNTIYKNKFDPKLRTILLKELMKKNIFMPWISICSKHNDKDINYLEKSFKHILPKIRYHLGKNFKKYSIGRIVKPVFRKFN